MTRVLLLCFVLIFSVSGCTWLSKEWDERPKWLMPDSSLTDSNQINEASERSLVSGFSLRSSPSDARKDISSGGLKYEKSKDDSKSKLLSYSFGGTLLDISNDFNYSSSNSTVNFFEGSLLSTRVVFKALDEKNLEEIVNSLYRILVDVYSSPKSEDSIYSFQTFKWKDSELEIYLSVDEEKQRVLITEINSKLEESRSFKEFKKKYIDQYQTYEDEVRYGKPNP
jgi:hypothetical protein